MQEGRLRWGVGNTSNEPSCLWQVPAEEHEARPGLLLLQLLCGPSLCQPCLGLLARAAGMAEQPILDCHLVRTMVGGRGGEGSPPAQTLLALPQVPAGGRPGSFGPTELDHNCSFGLRAPGLVLLLAPLGGPAVLLLLWLVGPGQVGSTLHECNLCLYLALEFRAAVYPRGTHRSSSQLALGWGCGWGWETGRQGTGRGWGAQSHWEQLAPPLAGKGSGREVEGLSAGLPGGCMPTAECRWADSWPGAVGQLESWSARRETGPGAAYSESSHPGGHPPPSHGGCVAQNSAGLPAGCQEQGSGREMQVCGWHKA